MIRIGINGLGRVGRILVRQILLSDDFELVVINELDPDIKNLVYLLKHDSIYGRFGGEILIDEEENAISYEGNKIKIYSFSKTEEVPWQEHDLDVLIDATGVSANVKASHKLINKVVPKVIITHSPPVSEVDLTVIIGVNESSYDPKIHHVVSSSICDASAVAPLLYELGRVWEIESCIFTTLHPWLSYQNLLDGSVSSVSSPGHFWKDYSIGRSSVLNLIPKDTTAAVAVLKVIPKLKGKLDAISFRVPTNIVSASDLTIIFKSDVSVEAIHSHIKEASLRGDNVFELQEDHLVSSDHIATNKSVIVDANRTKVLNNRVVKMVAWYDNEWGYSSKVVEIARLLTGNRKIKGGRKDGTKKSIGDRGRGFCRQLS